MFAFRWNHRQSLGVEDAERAAAIIKASEGKRLTYRRGRWHLSCSTAGRGVPANGKKRSNSGLLREHQINKGCGRYQRTAPLKGLAGAPRQSRHLYYASVCVPFQVRFGRYLCVFSRGSERYESYTHPADVGGTRLESHHASEGNGAEATLLRFSVSTKAESARCSPASDIRAQSRILRIKSPSIFEPALPRPCPSWAWAGC